MNWKGVVLALGVLGMGLGYCAYTNTPQGVPGVIIATIVVAVISS